MASVSEPPSLTSEFGKRAYSYSAPSVWNDLPLPLRSLHTFPIFRSQLKTYLFWSIIHLSFPCDLANVRASDSSLCLIDVSVINVFID